MAWLVLVDSISEAVPTRLKMMDCSPRLFATWVRSMIFSVSVCGTYLIEGKRLLHSASVLEDGEGGRR